MRTRWLLLLLLAAGCDKTGNFGRSTTGTITIGSSTSTGGTTSASTGTSGTSTGSTGTTTTTTTTGSTGVTTGSACGQGCHWCGQSCICNNPSCPDAGGATSTGTSGSGSVSSGSSSSGSSTSGSGSTGSGSSSGSTGAVDAGVYTYTLTNNTYWCWVNQGGMRIQLVADDAGCETQMPACIGEALPLEPEVHVPEPMRVAYLQEPPADGPHWGCWAPWDQSHAHVALPAERFIHNSEHAGVVLLYRCDPDAGLDDGGSCDALAEPLIEYATDGGPLVPDGGPDVGGDMRYLVTARPQMSHTYAAIAWGWRIEFDDFDAGLLDCFANAHLGAGPENFGSDPSMSQCPQSYAP